MDVRLAVPVVFVSGMCNVKKPVGRRFLGGMIDRIN